MENKQTQIEQSKQSIAILNLSDKAAIGARIGEVAILKGISLSEFQLSVWVKEIEQDIEKGIININGVKKALEGMPREKTYASLDYYTFYELAKIKSNPIDEDVKRTKVYLNKLREKN